MNEIFFTFTYFTYFTLLYFTLLYFTLPYLTSTLDKEQRVAVSPDKLTDVRLELECGSDIF
jgi:hypothetical protein